MEGQGVALPSIHSLRIDAPVRLPRTARWGMPPDLRRAITTHARRHHGLITREQLLGLGATGRAIDWAIAAGDLTAVFPGVYRVAGAPDTWRGRALAAVWRIDRQARRRRGGDGRPATAVAVTGPAAAHLHGLPGFGRPPRLLVVASRRVRSTVPVVHRAALTTADIDEVDGIPVTGLAWTTVDLAASCARGPASDLVAHVLGTGRCRPGHLLGPAHRTIELPGRSRIIGEIRTAMGPVDHVRSRSEAALADACADVGIGPPARNRTVRTSAGRRYELDLAWLAERLDVEVDGPHHLLPTQRRRDRARDRDLRRDGWEVLRVPVEELDEDLDGVVRRVGLALDGRSTS